jgi:hypothetical protein
MSNAYTERNAEWRRRLLALVDGMTDADMARAVGDRGWTAGGYLCHLAFWDQRALVLLAQWKEKGISDSPNDVDVVNESMRPFLTAIQPAEIRRLVRGAASAIDSAIDALEPGFLARVESDGKPVHLDRAKHREHHIAQVERAMA